MVLTGHELTAAPSAVAALAIVGGYLGVRSVNRSAVKIARERDLVLDVWEKQLPPAGSLRAQTVG